MPSLLNIPAMPNEIYAAGLNMTWTPHGRWMRLHESLFPERHRVARAISESGRLATVVAERGSVTDALHAIWDELTSLSS